MRKSDRAELAKAASELRSAWLRIGRILVPMADVGQADGAQVDGLRQDVVGAANTVDQILDEATRQ